MITAILFSLLTAGTLPPWQDPACNAVAREPMHTTLRTDREPLSLDGVWDFRLEPVGEELPEDAPWGSIPVPGVWELNGYGDPVYVCNGYPWKWYFPPAPPAVPEDGNRTGHYRRTVNIPQGWRGEDDVFLRIGAAASNVEVTLNGQYVGYSEDSHLAAVFKVDDLLREGENQLEMKVMRWCDGTWLEDQDMWRMTGIFRSVTLERRPAARLEDIRITARADGTLSTRLQTTPGVGSVRMTLYSPTGKQVKKWTPSLSGGTVRIRRPKTWSAETPDLYTLQTEVFDTLGHLTETVSTEVGFRDVEVRGKQLLINGKPVLIKGINRHELSPTGGYCVTRAERESDIRRMKELNINAVRTSHYPDDPYWYSLCDRYGIYVMDEANIESHGIGYDPDKTLADKKEWAQAHAERFRRMVQRDFNHPSIILWSLGNEAGNGSNHAENYAWARQEDPSRPVIYQKLRAARDELPYTDIEFYHYRSPEFCEAYLSDGQQTKPFLLQEYAHAMGNSLGNFAEYWELVRRYDGFQGGFIWDFADQALLLDGKTYIGGDFNAHDAWNASLHCNGLLTTDRQLHPHAYEAAHVMRNVLVTASPEEAFDGRLHIRNEFFFKDLKNVRMEWTLLSDGIPLRSGRVSRLGIRPGEERCIRIGRLSRYCKGEHDVVLQLSFVLKEDEPLLSAGTVISCEEIRLCQHPVLPDGKALSNGWKVTFDAATGALRQIEAAGHTFMKEPLMPCFGRAITENDKGAHLDETMAFWLYPDFRPVSCTASVPQQADAYVFEEPGRLEVLYDIGRGIRVRMQYRVEADARIVVTESLEGETAAAPEMFRFGVEMALPEAYRTLQYYGKGPFENYADRCTAARTGLWRGGVAEQYHWGYVRPQESGNHTGLHYMLLTDADGTGLCIRADAPFSGSALPLSRQMLDLSLHEPGPIHRPQPFTWQRHYHSYELVAGSGTYLHIDQLQMGVGGIDTWGSKPLEKYRIPAEERAFSFVLQPWQCMAER